MGVAKILRIYLDEVPLNRARNGNFVVTAQLPHLR